MDFLTSLVNSMPGAVAQGLIWGIMAIGVYITYRILDVADLTVDLFIDDNRGVFDSCNNSAHGSNSLFNTRKGMLRNGSCPQTGQSRVFCILSRAVLCGSGENPFPMPRKISPQAG